MPFRFLLIAERENETRARCLPFREELPDATGRTELFCCRDFFEVDFFEAEDDRRRSGSAFFMAKSDFYARNVSASPRSCRRSCGARAGVSCGATGKSPSPTESSASRDSSHKTCAPNTHPKLRDTDADTCSREGAGFPRISSSRCRLVTGRLQIPHGIISWKYSRSFTTLRANPCEVTPRET